jgi:hypothetical protein
MMDGVFGRLFRSRLQPVEIGRRIVREMEENRTVSVNRVYAPNEFRIAIGPEDNQRFTPMRSGLEREFSELVLDSAKQRRWNLMGMPRISFIEDESFGKGEYRVEPSLSADPGGDSPRASVHEPADEDLSATRAVSFNTAERLGLSAAAVELVALDDSGAERDRISITRAPVTIGRLSTNDVVLSDPNVSRHHAELRRDGDKWVLVDLGSTNGTTVNGKLSKEHTLAPDDRIGFGTSELVFRMRESG